MNLFRKKQKEKTTDVMITSKVNKEWKNNSNELKVELTRKNYIIFSDCAQKYLCLNDDFNNPLTFEDYTESIHGTVLLRKGDSYALLYYSYESGKYEMTDFTFATFIEEKHSLLLTTSDNKKHLYFNYVFFNDILEHVVYDIKNHTFLLIKYHDHAKLYKECYHTQFDLLFTANSIELCTVIKGGFLSSTRAIFKYKIKDSNLFNYFVIDEGYLSDIQNPNNYASIEVINYSDNDIAIIGKNENGKKCIFDIYTPDNTSEFYDDVKNTKNLFLCQNGNNAEIIDIEHNIYQSIDFTEKPNLSLLHDDKNNRYILTNNDEVIILLYFYGDYHWNDRDFYSIFISGEKYGTLYNNKSKFILNNYIKYHESHHIFEFVERYLKASHNVYAFYVKNASIGDMNFSLDSESLKDIYYFDEEKYLYTYLHSNHISTLKKCNTSDIENIEIVDGLIVIHASNNICNFTISNDGITVSCITGEKFEINVSDIKTNLTDYIFEHITNKFSIAYLKYRLNW